MKVAVIIFLNLISFVYSQETGSVMDVDSTTYMTVKIGDQWWMAENLKVIHYRNGDLIPNVRDNSAWNNMIYGAYCYPNNNEKNGKTYGNLYNWYAANDNRNIAPEGWHVPSDAEWQTLVNYLGGDAIAGGKMKTKGTIEAGTGLWYSPNVGATNMSGFSALPGCPRYGDGSYDWIGVATFFWSSTESSNPGAFYRILTYDMSSVRRRSQNKTCGLSVRCLKDQDTSSIESKNVTPNIFELSQNYPNPFNSETVISYTLPTNCYVKLTIYNIKGEMMETLVDSQNSAGLHTITWAADNVSNGLYFYQLQAGDIHNVKKMIIEK
jgi:uncharacterized protein (TIGR02145 family)